MEEAYQENITVEFTRGQFEDLVRCMYLAQWMINGVHTDDERNKRYEQLEQYIYALARKMEIGDMVEFFKEQNRFILKDEFVEGNEVERYRREYDDEIFWSELIQRLATSDFVERWGTELLTSIGSREEVEKRQPFLKKYIDEFEKNSVQNIRIQE